ncbi:MAG: NfeD family protein [Sedimentisphaerales bacterium]|jgi:membrane-bound serine protease (ClpP class)|nr:NfeD family protein [Sedimentisphaerales bacterium]
MAAETHDLVIAVLLATGLYVASGIILFVEVFVPSGGLLLVCGLASAAGGLVICFRQGQMVGWIGLLEAIVVVPVVFGLTFKILPDTRFGRGVTLTPPQRPIGDGVPDAAQLEGLIGQEGTVLTPLRPVGICRITGKRIECMAEGRYLDPGTRVEVIGIQGAQLTVRPIEDAKDASC